MKLFNKLLFSFYCLSITVNVYCEYLVFDRQEAALKPISNQSHYAKIYDLLMTYQWPMVLGAKVANGQLAELKNGEELFLRKKINVISSI